MRQFQHYLQKDEKDCGATCLQMIMKYYGTYFPIEILRRATNTSREGASLYGIGKAAEDLHFTTYGARISANEFSNNTHLPAILHWNQEHFVVLYKNQKKTFYIADPAIGKIKYNQKDFEKHFHSSNDQQGGIALILEPNSEFKKAKNGAKHDEMAGAKFLLSYIKPYQRLIIQLLIGILSASVLQLSFPFLTQSIVDVGIKNKDTQFIYLILFAQLSVFLGRSTIEIIRTYLVFHITSRLNIRLVSDFFSKLMRLPISYFDSKLTGDILQRLNDSARIENFLSGNVINTMFSIFTILIFIAVLGIYNVWILSIFVIGSMLNIIWVYFFLKRRAELDHIQFQESAKNQSKTIEIITGMQEIKLNNSETLKRWEWEETQVNLFKTKHKTLNISQIQIQGGAAIGEIRNILISFLSAYYVVNNSMTLGVMLAISYATGYLTSPITEITEFAQKWQNAKLSLERMNEIHGAGNVEIENQTDNQFDPILNPTGNIIIENLSFSYNKESDNILEKINLTIPEKKVTAIVGYSGSGKTTLLKIILKFYQQHEGEIKIGNDPLNSISDEVWRDKFGAVMQEGYIFSDTIAKNICIGGKTNNKQQLLNALNLVNLTEFVESLPLGIHTKIGLDGQELSTGQKQRVLIARAIYKNPEYLFFDEATSALDAHNEKIIVSNLNEIYKNKTVLVIAHRLSTVMNADQIVVLNKGRIEEAGTHFELIAKKNIYYNLVKNQLQIAS